jgi:4-diphosphocytidyl-2-C-methyl-D-erythritol kinase
LFLVGGTVLGVGRGEEVYPLPDLPAIACVVATPEIGVSTPKAFADWDLLFVSGPQGLKPASFGAACGTAEAVPSRRRAKGAPRGSEAISGGHDFSRADIQDRTSALAAEGAAELRSAWTNEGGRPHVNVGKLTAYSSSDRMVEFGRVLSAWLGSRSQGKHQSGKTSSGVPVSKGRGRAETPLLDLVRTGIENDFERVVFPKYPELREVKSVLGRAGAIYASLSGSGSATYGLFASCEAAEKAAARLRKDGIPATATTTLTRPQYWKKIFD